LGRVALKAVVGLPESTFAATGTRARTALLLARKERGGAGPVLLASGRAESRRGSSLRAYLAEVLEALGSRCGHVSPGGGGRSG